MSIKKLFDNNKQAVTVGKFLKLNSPDALGDGIESAAHLKEAVKKRDYFLPPVDYSDPENFVKFGSAEQYYKNAFEYISSYYPYDGSNLERVQFYNKINPLEKYILEDVYPTSTGFITIGSNYGTPTANATGYYSTPTDEYIQIKGGPHSGSIYNEEKNRTSNLEFGGTDGTTVEFFLKKNSLINSSTESERQVVFDLWNGATTTAADYGRLRIELVSGSEDRFYVTMRSGSNGFTNIQIPSAGGQTISDGTFRNFSFVFNTSGSSPTIDFFVNGTCVETAIAGAVGDIGLVTGSMIGNIGALRTDISGLPGAAQGYGKLSASVDEFRFWKTNRNDEQIGRYWFDNVGGGTDKYDANVSLGVYLKFNEGITQTASVDQVCLDYSGRLSNGLFVGYDATRSRNTGSAINLQQLESVVEIGDPIVRTDNPLYTALKARYILSGSNYDYNNNARLLNHFPNWIVETEENNSNELVNITQVIASYFDTLYNQLTALKELRHIKYISGSLDESINEYPYNDRLVESMGLEMPEFFENAGTLQQFLQRDEQINFDDRLVEIKNSIYKNIYNNLAFILKSKGTEKSIRNFIRCLGVSEEIIALNTYPDNSDFEIKSNYLSTTSTKKFADFTGLLDQSDDEATVYQYYESGNSNSKGFITGSSTIQEYAFALQGEVVFPDKDNQDLLPYNVPRVLTASIMGFHTPLDTDQTSTDLTWETPAQDHGLQVYLVRSPGEYAKIYQPDYRVRDGYFMVKDRSGATLLTSSIFNDVYDNQKWNLTLSLRPKKYPFTDGIVGASVATDGYTLELYGVNYDTGIKRNSFLASASVAYAVGSEIIKSNKRVYVGAHRTNFTGSVIENTDIRASSIRFWTDYLPTGTLDLQAREADSFGRQSPYNNVYSFQATNPNVYIPKIQTLALNWDFGNVTGSDSSGRFTVADFSSGSAAGDYPAEYQGSTFSKINLRQHTGRGDFFKASFTPVRKEYIYTDKLQIPEYVGGEEMVKALNVNENTFGIYTRPETFYFAVERSMYRSISNRMLELFSSIDEFNNLIGEPVNKYRLNYKRMEKIREIFFRKVKNDIPDLEKYIDYYKWLDASMNQVIEEFFPESARHASDVRKVVENHVLERPKIRHKISILKSRHPDDPGGILGATRGTVCLDAVGWGKNHHPISDKENENCTWWRTRAERDISPLVATGGVLLTRNAILNAISREVGKNDAANKEHNLNSVVCLSANFIPPYYGGTNQDLSKKRRLRDLTFDRFEALEDCTDELEPNQKKKIAFRATKDGVEYKGNLVTPFTALSSSITTGYNASLVTGGLTGISLTNLHEDSVHPFRHSVPMQGPFTERWVGGIQARHNAPFRTADRAEEYNLEIASGTGSITTLTTENKPKGQYLRGLSSKSPVNINNIKTVISGNVVADGVRKVGNYSKYYEVVQGNDRSQTNMDFVFTNENYNHTAPTAFLTPPNRRAAAPATATIVISDSGAIINGETFILIDSTGVSTTYTINGGVLPAAGGGTAPTATVGFSGVGGGAAGKIAAAAAIAIAINNTTGASYSASSDGVDTVTITQGIGGIAGNTFTTNSMTGTTLSDFIGGVPSLTGSADYPAPRQISSRRINETIIADRFSAPGSKQDSKQQFRDVNSDQFSPNNALPFRNIVVRLPHSEDLRKHSEFGGYESGSTTVPSIHKIQRNRVQQPQIGETFPVTTIITGSTFDNAYVTRPVPAADRSQWTSYILGADNSAVRDEYIGLRSKYPQNISFTTQSSTEIASFTDSVFSNINNANQFIWANNRDFVPWVQIRNSENPYAKYYTRKNTYEILPEEVVSLQAGTNLPEISFADGSNGTLPTQVRQVTDRKNNASNYYFSVALREPPVTSRYKPLVHQIRTPLGTPAKTSNNKTTISLKYSYGNDLMGFANRELNRRIQGRSKFSYGTIKRPYEIMREQFVPDAPNSISGVDLIKVFSYSETIYPKEVYTYLSGSRARLSFVNDFWLDDSNVTSFDASSLVTYSDILNPTIQTTLVRQLPRMLAPHTTSQGYVVQAKENTPFNALDPSYQMATGAGSASIWPMDSFMFADSTGSLATVLTASVPVLLADAATMPCGELMMTHYGTIDDGLTNTTYTNGTASYQTASINSSQYVYNIPVAIETSTAVPAVAARAAITASYDEGQLLAAANAIITITSFSTAALDPSGGSSLTGGRTIIIPDNSGNTVTFYFSSAKPHGTVTRLNPIEYVVDIGGVTSIVDVANSLHNGVLLAQSNSDLLVTPDPAAITSGKVYIVADALGSGINGTAITGTGIGTVATQLPYAGGSEYTYNAKTLLIDDDSHGTVSYSFDSSLAHGSSNLTTIGTSGATAAQVAAAIRQTINLSQGAGNINVTAGTVVGNTVPLTADNAGIAMNGEPIAGSAEADGGIVAVDFAHGAAGYTSMGSRPEPRSPGSVYTRPAWTAGLNRRLVDGPNKGNTTTSVYPFYNSYEVFAQDIRLAAKDHTIVPEYRISEHVSTFQQQGSLFALVSASLEITGAVNTINNGAFPQFYDRYCETDDIEFLEDFMPTDEADRNFIFNKYPRHFEMNSEAVIKLLPYSGFYPVDRTLDIAALFSSSYGPNAIITGADAAKTQAWRSILRPFYAPGIMYNSIKSGIAVDYPIRRSGRNDTQFEPVAITAADPLQGALSGALDASVTSTGQVPGNSRRSRPNSDWGTTEANKFFWADRLPFETILDPVDALQQGFQNPTVLSDINQLLVLDASGSINPKSLDDSLYKKAVSNFLANVPKFFLRKKTNKFGSDGHLTKFVSQFGKPATSEGETSVPVRSVEVDKDAAYMMEIGLLKTDNFNFYSNPYAFGIPTATGSQGWDSLNTNQVPTSPNWPKHRGEFAPFTPPHYYGPSLVRITFVPSGDKDAYTLDEIINNDRGEVYVQFLNESGSYYDFTSGSFVDRDGNTVTTTTSPDYGWNRAWQNRMDIDASININNEFPIDSGGTYKSSDPNKWVIMPKWECPTLDFPDRSKPADQYAFSSSVTPSEYTSSAQGMWHQYGIMPNNNEGSYLYIKDIPTGDSEEFDYVAIGTTPASDSIRTYTYVSKVPKFVSDADKSVKSLADLCGFDPEEIIRSGFDFSKAKRLGELAEDDEKSMSEAILALPFYLDKEQKPRLITLQAPADKLGPKIKQFRKQFTKFSLPPSLASKLLGMVPSGYPNIPDVINPFGGDDYDSILSGESMAATPVVYLMEHKVNLTRQDLADIWQGIMPDLSTNFKTSLSAVDHYMPGDRVEEETTRFPEVLREQLNLGVNRDGHPRYDLLDIADHPDTLGLFPDIKWLVFKVKERGISDYSQMVVEEVEGDNAFTFDSIRQTLLNEGLGQEIADRLLSDRDKFSKSIYIYKHKLLDPTFNWPYDFCSLIELGKINTKIGFRPELNKEVQEYEAEGRFIADQLEEAVEQRRTGALGADGLPGLDTRRNFT